MKPQQWQVFKREGQDYDFLTMGLISHIHKSKSWFQYLLKTITPTEAPTTTTTTTTTTPPKSSYAYPEKDTEVYFRGYDVNFQPYTWEDPVVNTVNNANMIMQVPTQVLTGVTDKFLEDFL